MRTPARLLRVFRVLLALATFAVVWLVASPARAAAPVCDPRGAIMFAPPPQLQDPEQSLDVPTCDGRAEDPLASEHVAPGRAGGFDLSSDSREQATAGALVVPLAAPLVRVAAPEPVLARAPCGVRTDVERPPRG